MSDLVRWDPFEPLRQLREEWPGFFSPGPLLPWGFPQRWLGPGVWGPSADVEETESEVVARIELPGADPAELDVTITEDGLSVSGEIKQETDNQWRGYRRIERRYGRFQRTLAFPVPVDHERATASYRNGILEVRAPKAADRGRRAIRLKVNAPSPPGQLSH